MIRVDDITKYFQIERGLLRRKVGQVKAVDGVSMVIKEGQTLGLVGESGCGKTTVGKLLLGLLEPDSGKIIKDEKYVVRLETDKKVMDNVVFDNFKSI